MTTKTTLKATNVDSKKLSKLFKLSFISLVVSRNFCTFVVPKNIESYANSSSIQHGSYAVGPDVFPLHFAADRLAETTRTAR